MTQYITALIATAKTAKKAIEYDHQTKTRRITSLKKRRHELLTASRAAINQVDAAIRHSREKDFSDRPFDAGG